MNLLSTMAMYAAASSFASTSVIAVVAVARDASRGKKIM